MRKFGETENASHKELTWSSGASPGLLFRGEVTMTLGFALVFLVVSSTHLNAGIIRPSLYHQHPWSGARKKSELMKRKEI